MYPRGNEQALSFAKAKLAVIELSFHDAMDAIFCFAKSFSCD